MLRELAFHSGGCVGTGRGQTLDSASKPDTTTQMQAARPQHHGRIQPSEIRGCRTTSVRLLNTSKGGDCTASPGSLLQRLVTLTEVQRGTRLLLCISYSARSQDLLSQPPVIVPLPGSPTSLSGNWMPCNEGAFTTVGQEPTQLPARALEPWETMLSVPGT